MMFNYNLFPQAPSFDFEAFFDNPSFRITDLFSVRDIVREVKNSGEVFEKFLIKHPQVIKELIDTALRPEKIGVTDVEHSYISCEIIAAQGEIFLDYIFKEDGEKEGEQTVKQEKKEEEKQEQVAKQPNGVSNNKQQKLFLYLFKALDDPKELNGTVGGYLLRIFSQLHYQNPEKTFEQLSSNRQLLSKCVRHLSNPSITEILIRIVCSYGESLMKAVQKIPLALEIFSHPFTLKYDKEKQEQESLLLQTFQNVQFFVDELVQKSQEFSFYICEEILSIGRLKLVAQAVETHAKEHQILQQIAKILSTLCELFIKEEKEKEKKKRCFGDYEDENSLKEPRVLNNELLIQLSNIARGIFKYTKDKSCIFSCKLMGDISKINSNKTHFFLDKQSFESYKVLLNKYPNNNIMHNQIKKIIIQGIKHKNLESLGKIIQYINDNCQSGLRNQLYHISNVINDEDVDKQYLNSWVNVKEWREKLKVVYSTVIPEVTEVVKKSRQLDDFLSGQAEIYSEEDMSSSEGMSPKHIGEVEEQEMIDILIYSDDENDKKNKQKEKEKEKVNQALFVVKSAENIEEDEIKQEIEQVKQGDGKQSLTQSDIIVIPATATLQEKPFEVPHKGKSLQGLLQDSKFLKMTTTKFWKNVLFHSLEGLMSDLEKA